MQDDQGAEVAIVRSAMSKASWRIVPLLGIGYLMACMDRSNISFASTQMNADLHFSATIYGFGAGLFFISYGLFEVPSNLMLVRFGARRWIARIMITWGMLATATMFVRTPGQFYCVRFLLGLAEAGFFPGVVFYMAQWFPKAQRGRVFSRFYAFGPLSSIIMGLVSGWLLKLDGLGGLRGWRWLFLCEGLPAVLIGVAILILLPGSPATSKWLTAPEKDWIARALAADDLGRGARARHGILQAMRNPFVLSLGVIGAFGIGCYYSLNLSAPAVLMAGTGLDVIRVGYVTSAAGLLAAIGMVLTGALSDRLGGRFGIVILAMLLMAAGAATMAAATSPRMMVAGYVMFVLAWMSVTNGLVVLGADLVPAESLAVGCAAINSMNFVGGFAGPFLWGWAKDATGTYTLALAVMSGVMLTASVLVAMLRTHTRRQAFGPALASA